MGIRSHQAHRLGRTAGREQVGGRDLRGHQAPTASSAPAASRAALCRSTWATRADGIVRVRQGGRSAAGGRGRVQGRRLRDRIHFRGHPGEAVDVLDEQAPGKTPSGGRTSQGRRMTAGCGAGSGPPVGSVRRAVLGASAGCGHKSGSASRMVVVQAGGDRLQPSATCRGGPRSRHGATPTDRTEGHLSFDTLTGMSGLPAFLKTGHQFRKIARLVAIVELK